MKHANRSGFTIIEVVITIAIGAAVMALVLNAVAGARRSQRNNARAADVNQIAAGVNQYIATRNALPENFSEISNIIDPDKFGHYDVSSVNNPGGWVANKPAPSTTGVCTPASAGGTTVATNTQANCLSATFASATPATGAWTAPSSTGKFDWDSAYGTVPMAGTGINMNPATGKSDYLMVINEAGCASGNKLPEAGGIREVAIIYSLEGQSDLICLEV